MTASFVKTPKQVEALEVLNRDGRWEHHPDCPKPDGPIDDLGHCDHCEPHRAATYSCLYGGARSAKSTIIVRNVFLRAMKRTSKHLMLRFRFNHARTSLAHETVPFVLRSCFPGANIRLNKSEWYWTVPAADGGESTVWLGGTDNDERMDKVLGTEYSTIFLNEASEIPWDAVPLLQTRLAENSGLDLRFYVDLNPPSTKHWTRVFFQEGRLPLPTGRPGEPHAFDTAHFQMNPKDNPHLPPATLATLKALPPRQRKRFLEGLYLAEVEGALWTEEMLIRARLRGRGELRKGVIVVDPSTTDNPGSDECGIVACGLDEFKKAGILKDYSLKASPAKTGARIIQAYEEQEANYVWVEGNGVGDYVRDLIKLLPGGRSIKVKTKQARASKLARAEPVAELYELGDVWHDGEFPELDAELTETDFGDIKQSPNRLDAAVHGITHLAIKKRGRIHA